MHAAIKSLFGRKITKGKFENENSAMQKESNKRRKINMMQNEMKT